MEKRKVDKAHINLMVYNETAGNPELLSDGHVPYFCWDRNLTVADIHKNLHTFTDNRRTMFIAWLMREAAFQDVWYFLTPEQVCNNMPKVEFALGRKRNFWKFIMGKWHELGKI